MANEQIVIRRVGAPTARGPHGPKTRTPFVIEVETAGPLVTNCDFSTSKYPSRSTQHILLN